MRGASVRRQTAHAMRCMQTLVRVQAQVRASRVEAMERRNRQHHGAMLRDGGRWRAGSQVSEGPPFQPFILLLLAHGQVTRSPPAGHRRTAASGTTAG